MFSLLVAVYLTFANTDYKTIVRTQDHRTTRHSGAVRGGGGSFPLWVDVQKLCNMCVLSLSWNFFVSHDKYIARLSSKEPS